MQERYYDIAEAHQKTFEWIYERTDLKFVQWLQDGSGVYWITGKAGSGKSTLMKFISQDQRTRHYLPADIENVLVSRFFFHDRGQNPLLKSQEGLFRAILHSILSKYPGLIAIALPSRYERLKKVVQSGQQHSSHPAWSTNELRSGFEAIVSQSQIPLHLCLLIDGLDEFSGYYEDIIDTLKHLLPTAADSHVRVQMCLSSRPLEVFEESYSQHTHLRVQDLTEYDIKLYVTTKFTNIPRRADLLTEDPTTTNLIINEILGKAQGVFLWVTLVVRSLIEGLRNRDNMSTLRRRLSNLPAGLEPLYKRMIEKIDPLYHKEAGRTFNMVLLAARPLSPLAMSFSEHESREALSPQSILSDAQIEMRHSVVARQLKAHTAGLIEISEFKRYHRRERGFDTESSTQESVASKPWQQSRLQYLHLTVKEFILNGDVPTWLANEISNSTQGVTHLRIAACCLIQLRVTYSLNLYDYHSIIPRDPWNGLFNEFMTEDIIFMIMFHIRQAEQATNTLGFSYLKSLDGIVTKEFLEEILLEVRFDAPSRTKSKIRKQRIPHWTTLRSAYWREPDEWMSDYISYLVTIGMTHSVIDAFKRGYNPAAKPGRPLLLYAMGPPADVDVGSLERDDPEPAIIEELLKRKCDPSQALASPLANRLAVGVARTVWEALMFRLAQRLDLINLMLHNGELSNELSCDSCLKWLKTIELFLDYGADPKQLIINYGYSDCEETTRIIATHRLSSLSLFNQAFANHDNPLVSTVRSSMVAKGAIEFREDISEEDAVSYKNGVPDEWVRDSSAKSRLVHFFGRAIGRRQTRRTEYQRTKK
ncbi:hypothetical protein BJ166DRAFT_229544 [Pestalotiopsis sp. NC0098]|nr:hypothetical protein BJ166DRAFT_229544 [Pestalotiopsis sp. NC0098]